MSKPALITGANGFIGRRLVERLRRAGLAVRCHTAADGDIAHCALAYDDVGRVFHLAARTFVPDSWRDPLGFYEVNVLGVVNVLEFCRRQGAPLTFVSSYVYGAPRSLPISEDHPREAANPYSHTKIVAEDVCRFYAERHGVEICIVRPFNIYGPGQDGRFLIPDLLRQALDAGAATIEVGDERPKRDFLHVDDLVNLLVIAADRGATGVYNAGSGVSVGIPELVGILNELTASPKRLVSRNERRPQEIMEVVADVGKARIELGWAPEITLRSGLADMIRSVGEERPRPSEAYP